MAYDYALVGTQRIAGNHAYIGNTGPNYSMRVFNVSVYGASTSGSCYLVLASGGGAQLTTVTGIGTVYLAVSPSTSTTGLCWGQWENSYGLLIEGPVLLMTRNNFTFATVTYQQILK